MIIILLITFCCLSLLIWAVCVHFKDTWMLQISGPSEIVSLKGKQKKCQTRSLGSVCFVTRHCLGRIR